MLGPSGIVEILSNQPGSSKNGSMSIWQRPNLLLKGLAPVTPPTMLRSKLDDMEMGMLSTLAPAYPVSTLITNFYLIIDIRNIEYAVTDTNTMDTGGPEVL